mmetsp:Transcript_1991/g.7196  ORF Transcript_1991/g.7196 Transcript_1991/m.7196 type:complete len:219 (-) Transcript_1991:146-802(-)
MELDFSRGRLLRISRELDLDDGHQEEDSGTSDVPLISRCIYPGCRFEGKQRSTYKVYNVCVTIQDVDMENSELCGYLSITALTDECPVLTTFFEGEIIGRRYGFITHKWGADENEDLQHWSRFPQFDGYSDSFSSVCNGARDLYSEDVLFMRWKERFLVPDHSIKTVPGASYEGFYYICFDRRTSIIDGFYYHSACEKFQSLHMKLVPERASCGFDLR